MNDLLFCGYGISTIKIIYACADDVKEAEFCINKCSDLNMNERLVTGEAVVNS